MTDKTTTTTATRAVEALESLALGSPFAELRAAAEAACADLEDTATAHLAGPVEPVGADVWADFERYTDGFKSQSYAAQLATLHAAAQSSHPALARALRGPAVLHAIAVLAGGDVAADAAKRKYLSVVAARLCGMAEFEPSATILAETLPTLRARIDTTIERHHAHARAETDRVERARREGAAAALREESRRRAEIAEYFGNRPEKRFIIRNFTVISGRAIAAAARCEAARDDAGERFTLSLAELEQLHTHAGAAAADAIGV